MQVGAVNSQAAADKLAKDLKDAGFTPYIVKEGPLFKVRTGPYPDRAKALQAAEQVRLQAQPLALRGERAVTGRPAEPAGTPLMQQYREIKSRHRDSILFFRMGDFYEMFFEDAHLAARILNITLTARGDGVPLAGVPVKAAADYLRQLIAAGHRVAICEQVEDPKLAKGIVKREVIETITPGAVLEENCLPGVRNNFLVAVWAGAEAGAAGKEGSRSAGIAAIDLSTGEFLLETIAEDDLAEAVGRLAPAEVVMPAELEVRLEDGVLRTPREKWEFDAELARAELARRFQLASLDGLGLGPEDGAAIGAAGALLRYIGELQPAGLPHLHRPSGASVGAAPVDRRDDPAQPRAGRTAPRRRARHHAPRSARHAP